MAWPLASQFNAMLQNPQVAFRDPALQTAQIETDNLGQPRAYAGAFANVYKAVYEDGTPIALRVFTCDSGERRERYELISQYLKKHQLGCLCEFEYRDDAIRATDGKWYPLLLMEWVEGETLFKWAQGHAMSGNQEVLAAAAENWINLLVELAEAGIAHGDLQQGNVIIDTSGQLRLVDYDCMCVPSLVGRRNLELGVDAYQHPGRNKDTLLSATLDDFSGMAIYIALRALAINPALWQTHVIQNDNDKLLFSREDLLNPQQSQLYVDLVNLPDDGLRDFVDQLFYAANQPIFEAPSLAAMASEVVQKRRSVTFDEIEVQLLAENWDEAVELISQRGSCADAPNHLVPKMRQAYLEICRRDKWESYCQIPRETTEDVDRRLVATFSEKIFKGFPPAEAERMRVMDAKRRVIILEKMRRIFEKTRHYKKFTLQTEKTLLELSEQLPKGYHHSLEKRTDLAKKRVSVVEKLEKLQADPPAEAMIIAAWRSALECGATVLLDPRWKKRVKIAEKRAPVLKKLHDVPSTLSPVNMDKVVQKLWDERLFKLCKEADRLRPRFTESLTRLQLLEDLTVASADKDYQRVYEIITDPRLEDYPLPPACKDAINVAMKRVEKGAGTLLDALKNNFVPEFLEMFSTERIREQLDNFAPHLEKLTALVHKEILPLKKLGLKLPPDKHVAPIAVVYPAETEEGAQETPQFVARWNWPLSRYSQRCLLAICPEKPPETATPNDTNVHQLVPIDLANWEKSEQMIAMPIPDNWWGCYLAVWAVVDIGFDTYTSAPLVLGEIKG